MKTKLVHEQKIREAEKHVHKTHADFKKANSKLMKAEDDYTIHVRKAKTLAEKKKAMAIHDKKIKSAHSIMKKAHKAARHAVTKHHKAEDAYEIAVTRATKKANGV